MTQQPITEYTIKIWHRKDLLNNPSTKGFASQILYKGQVINEQGVKIALPSKEEAIAAVVTWLHALTEDSIG